MSQNNLPLWDAIKKYTAHSRIRLHVPGHGGGPGLPPELSADLARFDLTELPGLDDLFQPRGAILEAQDLAAKVWRADRTFFLVNGSSSGVLAMLLAACGPRETVLAPRNCHASFYHALVLTGADPVYIPVAQRGSISLNVTARDVEIAFAANPRAKALFLTSPTYHGVCADLEKIAQITAKYHAMLLVDEAHGAHLGFCDSLPPGAGPYADLRVQSWHKTLGAYTPGAVLHANGGKVDFDRLQTALSWVQTSSPPYPLLLSLDAVRKQMALRGKEIVTKMRANALDLRRRLQGLLPLLSADSLRDDGLLLDETKITLLLQNTGICGLEAARELRSGGIDVEMAAADHLLALVGPGYREGNTDIITAAVAGLKKAGRQTVCIPSPPPVEQILPPRLAAFARSCFLDPGAALNRTAAGMVVAYPPGLPIVSYGEKLTSEVICRIEAARKSGGNLRGLNEKGQIPVVSLEAKE